MNLARVEAELLDHARAERRRWQEIAGLLMRVEHERLWQGKASSFSAWLESLARRADLQESVFWRCLKAGRVYMTLSGSDRLDAPDAVSAEALELTEKIARHAPKGVTREIVRGTLEGELSRAELRDLWATYRPAAGGMTARGRLPDEPAEREEALAARTAGWESERRKPENRADVRRAEMIAAFRAATFLTDVEQARAETRTEGLAGRIAAMLVVRHRGTGSERLFLHGLWTCVSAPELRDFAFAAPSGADFMWLALPPELLDDARRDAPRMLGLLELGRDRALRTLRPAQRRPTQAEGRLALLSVLLERAYAWP